MKKAIIIGASSGIGAAMYNDLKTRGWEVLGVSRNGPDVFFDINNINDMKAYPSPELEMFISQKIDMVVYCAGIMPLSEIGYESGIMNTNFWGAYYFIRYVRPFFRKNAVVVYIGSVSAHKPDKDIPIYACSKAALSTLCKANALLDASNGVRHICIEPVFFNTNLVPGETPVELINQVPLHYEELPENIAHLPYFCYSTPYLTGSTIVIDGGLSL